MPTIRSILLTLLAAACASAAPLDLVTPEAGRPDYGLRNQDGTEFHVRFLAPNLIRIQAHLAGREMIDGDGKAPIVTPQGRFETFSPDVTSDDDHVEFVSDRAILTIHARPLRFELRRPDGTIIFEELKPLSIESGRTALTLSSDPDERIYGGGQQNGTFEFKGRLMEISYSGGWEEGDRPSPAPFFMSDRGYGMLRNTWSDGVYDFRSDRYLTATHDEEQLDVYVMVGDSIREVLDAYTELTGRAPLLPRWAFGYGDADCYNDGDNADKPGTVPEDWSDGPTGTTPDVIGSVAAKYREHDMPGSWILPNDGYGCGYVDLPEVVTGLRELGFRTGLWTEDGVEKIAWEVGTAGTRVQKLDVAWTGKGKQWAMDANHDAARGFLDNSDARPFIWTVMGWAGIQRYAVTWTGDQSGSWDYIRWHVPTLIGSGLSGMNYSTGDVDGIFGGSPETFTRDLQWKCFTPVLMGMSGWSKASRKHPWWFDEPYRSINRRYLKLRRRLMPYLYTLAKETEDTGAPMVRGVFWDHPDDAQAFDHPYQFLLGRDLLVAPVYRSQAASGGWRKDVYLPEGRWIDYWNGTVIEAGRDGRLIDVPVDLETLPVFVRAGAVIPLHPESNYEGEAPADPLTLDVYPHGASRFTLYEDDGETRAYLDGAFARRDVDVRADDERIDVVVGATRGRYAGQIERRGLVFALHTRVAPVSVEFDGETMPSEAWRYDEDDRGGVLYVEAGRGDVFTEHRLVVGLDPDAERTPHGAYPAPPAEGDSVDADALMVVTRPAEEPGYPLEQAFDGDPDTWFRTVRDQSVAYGPHEFTVSLGERRVIEGFRIAPRNDEYWEYGQVKHYEVHLADVNGRWGEPAAKGVLDKSGEQQEVRFAPRAGRLLRFRVLGTHDDGVDPMVLGAGVGDEARPYAASAPVRVGPTTISEFAILEHPMPDGPGRSIPLCSGGGTVVMNGLEFDTSLHGRGEHRQDFALTGDWILFRAEAGLDDETPAGTVGRFQAWGDGRLLWDSGPVASPATVKPRFDVRGVSLLSLRATAEGDHLIHWAEPALEGHGNGIDPSRQEHEERRHGSDGD